MRSTLSEESNIRITLWRHLYLVGACLIPAPCLWPPRNGKCELSNFSSMQSSIRSFKTGVQRDIWYVCSVIRSLRRVCQNFFRFPCNQKSEVIIRSSVAYQYCAITKQYLDFFRNESIRANQEPEFKIRSVWWRKNFRTVVLNLWRREFLEVNVNAFHRALSRSF